MCVYIYIEREREFIQRAVGSIYSGNKLNWAAPRCEVIRIALERRKKNVRRSRNLSILMDFLGGFSVKKLKKSRTRCNIDILKQKSLLFFQLKMLIKCTVAT